MFEKKHGTCQHCGHSGYLQVGTASCGNCVTDAELEAAMAEQARNLPSNHWTDCAARTGGYAPRCSAPRARDRRKKVGAK